MLQENMVEILLKHLERVCGIKHDKDDEESPVTLAKAAETNVEAIVQLLRLLQESMRICSETQRQHREIEAAEQHSQKALSLQSHRASTFLQEGSKNVMRMAKLLSHLLIDFEVPAVVKAAVRCARPFFFGLVDFSKLQPYNMKSDGKITSGNAFMTTSLRKIGERITGTSDSQQPEEKYQVYCNINSQQEDYTFLVTALYHWEERKQVIGPTQPTDPSKQPIVPGLSKK